MDTLPSVPAYVIPAEPNERLAEDHTSRATDPSPARQSLSWTGRGRFSEAQMLQSLTNLAVNTRVEMLDHDVMLQAVFDRHYLVAMLAEALRELESGDGAWAAQLLRSARQTLDGV